MQTEKLGVGDNVIARLGNLVGKAWSRGTREKISPNANVHAVLRGPDGEVKYEEWGENLVTDVGDHFIAARLYDDTYDIITGMKLGTGTVDPAKNTAGHEMGAYISGSNEALDSAATDATKGAGLGWRTTYVCTWVAGDVTDSAISEVCLTNQTALADNTCAAADTIARYEFTSPIDKQSGDSLEITWQIDILGA